VRGVIAFAYVDADHGTFFEDHDRASDVTPAWSPDGVSCVQLGSHGLPKLRFELATGTCAR